MIIKFYHKWQKRKSWEPFHTHPIFVWNFILDEYQGCKWKK